MILADRAPAFLANAVESGTGRVPLNESLMLDSATRVLISIALVKEGLMSAYAAPVKETSLLCFHKPLQF